MGAVKFLLIWIGLIIGIGLILNLFVEEEDSILYLIGALIYHCFYFLISNLFFPFTAYFRYRRHCKQVAAPILKFKQIRKFYPMNPTAWTCYTSYNDNTILIRYNGSSVHVKSFFDYWFALFFLLLKKIKKKNDKRNLEEIKNTANLIASIRADTERMRIESEQQLDKAQKETEKILARLENK